MSKKTLSEVCVGKTIAKIEAEPRGLYEGSFVYITFTDGSKVSITDGVTLIFMEEHKEDISYA